MSVENLHDNRERWFAIRVKPKHEKLVATIANNKGFEDFLPTYECRHRWSDRMKSVEFPLFPGYIFCRLDPQRRLPLLTIPGVLHFVGIGKIPVAIEDAEIAALQSAMRSGLSAEPWPFLETGQQVRLEEGPLAGMEGILIGTSKKDQLIVSVTLLKRSISIAIERRWVAPLDVGSSLAAQPKPFISQSSSIQPYRPSTS